MPSRFRIHPGIGVARVGNSDAPDGNFIGPEHPDIPANWWNGEFESFRDSEGRVKRQAARFRVFEYDEDEGGGLANPQEVELSERIVKIEWRVHVANKKASFFSFVGQAGSDDLFVARRQLEAAAILPESEGTKNLRNSRIKDRGSLEIDPGEVLISTETAGHVTLTNPNKRIPIRDLGELRLDGARLVFLGGHGDSNSRGAKPKIKHYANNDEWFDDTSDGSIKARVFLSDGTHQDADAAWVLVGPPDFAPGIQNVVTLWDILWDLAVHELDIPEVGRRPDGPFGRLAEQKGDPSLSEYKPSFLREVYPLLERPFGAFWTFEASENNQSLHLSFKQYGRLAAHNDQPDGVIGQHLRNLVRSRLRDPQSTDVDWKQMPRSFGDRYNDFDSESGPTSKSFLSLTRIQYAVLQRWATDQFDSDWPGIQPAIPPRDPKPNPDDLDAAALVNAVGGPFYPGIDVSWLIRAKILYSEPFRLKVPNKPEVDGGVSNLVVGAVPFGPGFFSQQMALPWQADFYDCHKEEKESPDREVVTFMWWTAHRPDSVLPAAATSPAEQRVRWVRRFDGEKTPAEADSLENLDRFVQMQAHWSTLRFIVGNRSLFKEENDT